MRFEEIDGKEVININTGKCLGKIRRTDIVTMNNREIESILLKENKSNQYEYLIIPLSCIVKVGSRTVIVNINV